MLSDEKTSVFVLTRRRAVAIGAAEVNHYPFEVNQYPVEVNHYPMVQQAKGQATQLMCLLIVQGSLFFSSSSRSSSCEQDRPCNIG